MDVSKISSFHLFGSWTYELISENNFKGIRNINKMKQFQKVKLSPFDKKREPPQIMLTILY